jgi:hypothetical protein
MSCGATQLLGRRLRALLRNHGAGIRFSTKRNYAQPWRNHQKTARNRGATIAQPLTEDQPQPPQPPPIGAGGWLRVA